jgi:CubicO group peptidase (beta-lactamase class C family)
MNVLNTNPVSRIGLKVFSPLLVVTVLACSIVTPTPEPAIPDTGPTPQATVDSTSPVATEEIDLGKVPPKPFDAQMQAELEAYITTVMQREEVPGAAVAVVQNGQVVFQQGFGVRELGKPDPVTPETLMMIGSTGKSMTTMMMATVVDEGKMTWDTPAVSILPSPSVT